MGALAPAALPAQAEGERRVAAVQEPARRGEGLDAISCAKVTRRFPDGRLCPAEAVQQPPRHRCRWERRGHAWGGGWSRSAALLARQPFPVLHVWFGEPGREEPCATLELILPNA